MNIKIIPWKHPIRKPEDSMFGYTTHLWEDKKFQKGKCLL